MVQPESSARKTRRYIDLHMHSTASDGAYSPARLMEMAAARGLAAVALTDHDTMAGVAEASSAAARLNLEFVPGIEFAAAHARGAMHILGYFVDPAAPVLTALLETILHDRRERNYRILDRLSESGIRVDEAALSADHAGAVIGRPHIAAALIRLGAARSMNDAFERFLGRSGTAYVERTNPTAEQIIATIRAAGGAAALAHPASLGCESQLELRTVIHRLRDAGLAALEVIHPDQSPAQASHLADLAASLRLVPTGGSDFHALPARLERGVGFRKVRVPYEWLSALREHAHQT